MYRVTYHRSGKNSGVCGVYYTKDASRKLTDDQVNDEVVKLHKVRVSMTMDLMVADDTVIKSAVMQELNGEARP